MSRTPEQVAADEALTAAILGCMQAYGDLDNQILGPYVVAVGDAQFTDNGDLDHSVWTHTRDNAVAFYVAGGLLREALRGDDPE